MKIRFVLISCAAAVIWCPPARAAEPIEVTNAVLVEVDSLDAHGARIVTLQPAATVTPGDLVIYAIAYRNPGNQAVSDLQINNPLAASLEYVGPQGGPEPLVSADGVRFARLLELTIAEAEHPARPALPSDVRHLRWSLSSAVAAGHGGEVAFRARLK